MEIDGLLLIKITVFWYIGTGFKTLLRHKENSSKDAIKNTLKENLRLAIIIEFVINFYTFNFWIELVLLPILVFISLMATSELLGERFKPVANVFNWVLAICGFSMLFFSLSELAQYPEKLQTVSTVVEWLLPLFLSIYYIPFVLGFTVFTVYENNLVVLKHLARNRPEKGKSLALEMFSECGLSLEKLETYRKRKTDEIIHSHYELS